MKKKEIKKTVQTLGLELSKNQIEDLKKGNIIEISNINLLQYGHFTSTLHTILRDSKEYRNIDNLQLKKTKNNCNGIKIKKIGKCFLMYHFPIGLSICCE